MAVLEDPAGRLSEAELYLDGQCQSDCLDCAVKPCHWGEEMTWARISTALDTWRALGGTRLAILGKEPALHPEFLHTVRYARAVGFAQVAITTTGLRATARRLRAVSPNEVGTIDVRVPGDCSGSRNDVRDIRTVATAVATGAELAERGFQIRFVCAVDRSLSPAALFDCGLWRQPIPSAGRLPASKAS